MSKKTSSLGNERQSDPQQEIYMLKHNVNILPEMNTNFLEVLSPILQYQHAWNQRFMSLKQTSIGIEQKSDPLEVLYILKHNEDKLPEIINNFLVVLSPIHRYHHAQNQGLCHKNRHVSALNENLTSRRSYTSTNTMNIHYQKWKTTS